MCWLYVCIVVFDFAALIMCWLYVYCGAGQAPVKFSVCCTCHMAIYEVDAWRAPDTRGKWPL